MTVTIFVIYFSDGWSTMVDRRRGARHPHKVDAIEAALRLVSDTRRNGHAALISVQDRFGEIRPYVEPEAAPAAAPLHPIHRAREQGFGGQRNGPTAIALN